MPIIPMKQTITVKRPEETDDYGRPINSEPIEMKCRFVESSKLVKRTSSGTGANQSMSEEVVSSAQVFLDKLADIRYTDQIFYTNELGIERKYSVLNIEVKRNIAGKPIMTVVYL